MKKEGEKSNDPFWIGLLVDSVEWADGGQSAYRNWECRYLNTDHPEAFMDNDGKWHKLTGLYRPLCYSKTTKTLRNSNKFWFSMTCFCNSK